LRRQGNFDEALGEATAYISFLRQRGEVAPADEDLLPGLRGANPSQWTLDRAVLRLDATASLLERREFEDYFKKDTILSVHIYTDGSPVLGYEIQGIVMDLVMKCGTLIRHTMIPQTLNFGFAGSLHKVLAVLWSIWLMVGHSVVKMRWFLNLIASITTDMGTELHLVDTVDILDAFMKVTQGMAVERAGAFFDKAKPLFPKALRIAGWNHLLGNMMKFSCKSFDLFPMWMGHLRVLCRFFFLEMAHGETTCVPHLLVNLK
jgi:hypothetical protein